MKSLLLLTIVFILGCCNQSAKTSGQAQSSPISDVSQMLAKSGRTATLWGVAAPGGKGFAALELGDGTIVMVFGSNVPTYWPEADLGRSMKATGLVFTTNIMSNVRINPHPSIKSSRIAQGGIGLHCSLKVDSFEFTSPTSTTVPGRPK